MQQVQPRLIANSRNDDSELVRRACARDEGARAMLRENVEKKIGPVVMEAFPFAGKRCERLTDAVLGRLGLTT